MNENLQPNFDDFPKSFKQYTVNYMINDGRYAKVFNVIDKNTKKEYACKAISRQQMKENGLINRLDRELRVLERINHPNIVTVYEIIYTEKYINIITEFCQEGTLNDHICKTQLNFPQVLRFSTFLISALEYLHGMGICHRDIKLDNIVLDTFMNPKIIDFGLCYVNSSSDDFLRKTICGTLDYLPPEVLSGSNYDGMKADIWSLGICIYAMMFNKMPYSGTAKHIINCIQKGEIAFPCENCNDLLPILKRMLQVDPNERPSASELYKMVSSIKMSTIKNSRIRPVRSISNLSKKKLIVKPQSKVSSSLKNVMQIKMQERSPIIPLVY